MFLAATKINKCVIKLLILTSIATDCCMNQQMCQKAVNNQPSATQLDWYKTKDMYNNVVSEDPFMIV